MSKQSEDFDVQATVNAVMHGYYREHKAVFEEWADRIVAASFGVPVEPFSPLDIIEEVEKMPWPEAVAAPPDTHEEE